MAQKAWHDRLPEEKKDRIMWLINERRQAAANAKRTAIKQMEYNVRIQDAIKKKRYFEDRLIEDYIVATGKQGWNMPEDEWLHMAKKWAWRKLHPDWAYLEDQRMIKLHRDNERRWEKKRAHYERLMREGWTSFMAEKVSGIHDP